jgi:hypothetical protein
MHRDDAVATKVGSYGEARAADYLMHRGDAVATKPAPTVRRPSFVVRGSWFVVRGPSSGGHAIAGAFSHRVFRA